MNIAVVHHRWSQRGGAEKYMVNLVKALAQRGHKITLYVINQEIPLPKEIEIKKISVPKFPLWLRFLAFAYFAGKEIKKSSYDVSIGFGKVWGLDVVRPSGGCHRAYEERMQVIQLQRSSFSAILKRVKSKVSIFKFVNRLIEDKMFSENPAIIAVSELVKNDINRYYPEMKGQIEVIFNGKNAKELNVSKSLKARETLCQNYNISKNSIIFLMVATNPVLKGLEELLKSFRYFDSSFLRTYNPHLILLGSKKSSTINRLIKQNGLSQRVNLISFTSEIENYYCGSDILVHPTNYDAFANVCLEAMSYGLPVLTTKMNGGSEIYTNFKNGIILNTTDSQKLAITIMKIVKANQLKEIGLAGYKLLNNYNFDKNINRVEKFLYSVYKQK